MRKESAAKDKEQKDAARALEQIEEVNIVYFCLWIIFSSLD